LKVTVKAFRQIVDILGAERTVDLPDGSRVEDLAVQLEQGLCDERNQAERPFLCRVEDDR